MKALFWNSALVKFNQGSFGEAADLGWDAFNSSEEPDPEFLDQVLALFMRCREGFLREDHTTPDIVARELLMLERTLEVARHAGAIGASQMDIQELERITGLMIAETRMLLTCLAPSRAVC